MRRDPSHVAGLRTGSRSSARAITAASVVFFLALLPLGAASGVAGGAAHGPMFTPPPPFRLQITAGSDAIFVASVGVLALTGVATFAAGTNLYLYNGTTNSTSLVTSVSSVKVQLNGITAAGGRFFVEWSNATSRALSFSTVTTAGVLAHVRLPLSPSLPWVLLPGTGLMLFASMPGRLVAIDPTSLAIAADYSSVIPPGLNVQSVAVQGNLIYLGGVQDSTCCGQQVFAGILNSTSLTVTTLTHRQAAYSSSLIGTIWSITITPNNVFFGGDYVSETTVPALKITTVGGYLFRFDPGNGTFHNLSSLLPKTTPAVFGTEAAGNGLVLNLAWFHLDATTIPLTFSQRGNTYFLPPTGGPLLNDSKLTGKTLVGLSYETSETAGLYFVGGTDTKTGYAQIDAVPLGNF